MVEQAVWVIVVQRRLRLYRQLAVGTGQDLPSEAGSAYCALVRMTRRAEQLQLEGARVRLRTLQEDDYEAWIEVRTRCRAWLMPWEPRPVGAPPISEDRASFAARCAARERERQLGLGYGFGIFLDGRFAGEVTLSSIQRNVFQSGFVGYWVDEAMAGQSLVPEAVVAVMRFAFEELALHRLEIAIVPTNRASRRVMEKLEIRLEGIALRFLEINGQWEDHARYGFTGEEWAERRTELVTRWLIPAARLS